MYLSGRERKIITFLLKKQEDVPISELAEMLGVSVRTLHRDLKGIEDILMQHHLELLKKPGAGIRIIGEYANREKLESELNEVAASEFTPEERQTIILSTLLEGNEPVKLFTLANELNVTVATISHDLDQLEKEIVAQNLTLIRKRGYGVEITGNEKDKRAVISNLISKNVDPFEFVSLVKENIRRKVNSKPSLISDRLLGLVNPEKLAIIEKRVEQAREELTHDLADSAVIGLVVHLALAIERLQKGDTISFDPEYLRQIEGTKEYAIGGKIIKDLEESLGMKIPDDEIGYITMHLMGAKLRNDRQFLMEDFSVDIALKAKELIDFVSRQLDMNFDDNSSLLNDMVAHLKPAIYRLNQGMNIKNPLIDEIKKDYDDLFQLVRQAADETFSGTVFPDDEIGYLVLHFAAAILSDSRRGLTALVICSSGIGTAKMLATRLKERIPEIIHVENRSLFDIGSIDPDDYDLIISTIQLKDFDKDYILTSPILTKSEIHRIQKVIRQTKLQYTKAHPERDRKNSADFIVNVEAMQNYTKVILDILNAFRISEITGRHMTEDVLQSVCQTLVEDRMITNPEHVLKKLLEREQLSGLGIPDTKMALYHTRSDDVIQPSFSIYNVADSLWIKGMDGDEMEMKRMLLMLAPEDTHQEVLEVFSFLSGLIIQSQATSELFETGSETVIKDFLTKEFHQFIKEKNLF